MSGSFLHSVYDVIFSVLPLPLFGQLMDLFAAFLSSFYGLFGLDLKFIGF